MLDVLGGAGRSPSSTVETENRALSSPFLSSVTENKQAMDDGQ